MNDELTAVRAAQNQSLFRNVNANLVSLNQTFEPLSKRSVFVCECAHMACIEQIELALDEYQRVRRNPRRFIVAPSNEHVLPGVERVVESHPSHFVVEKIEQAARVAEEMS